MIKSQVKHICIVLLLTFTGKAFSQSLLHPAFAEYNLSVGRVVKNYPVFPERNAAVIHSVVVGSRLNGSRAWHPYYRFPLASFEFNYGTLGNSAVLGSMIGGLYRLEFPFRLSDKWYAEPIAAFGIAAFTKHYHTEKNPDNTLVGSTFTFNASARLLLRYYITPFWSLQMNAGVYHCSNSHYQLPNLGVNLPVISAGVRYHIQPASFLFGKKNLERDKRWHGQVRLALGQNEQGASTLPVNGPRYPIYLGALYATHYLSPVNKFHAGVEGWYNTGVYDFITSQKLYDDKEHLRAMAFQAVVGNEFLFGHFSMLVNGGVYVYNPAYHKRLMTEHNDDAKRNLKGWLTARLGFQYYIKDAVIHTGSNFYAGVYIKTNLGQADFLETGVGYCF